MPVNNPHGLAPYSRGAMGGPLNTRTFTKPSGTATIFRNDACIAVTGGTSALNEARMPTGWQNCGPLATAGSGTFVGVALSHGLTGSITRHAIANGFDTVYDVQDDGVGGGLVVGNIGKNANLSVAVAGNLTTFISGQQLGQASVATTNSLDVQIHALSPDPNNFFGANTRVLVTLNRHMFAPGRTGV